MYTQSAYELWNEISEQYGQGNGPLVFQLQTELSNTKQMGQTVGFYYNKLKRIWDELQAYSNWGGAPIPQAGMPLLPQVSLN